MNDTRVAYGARCFWWDDVQNAGTTHTKGGLPCCPSCRSVLYEAPSEEVFLAGAQQWMQLSSPYDRKGYLDLLKWSKGKCFPSREHAAYIYLMETDTLVDVRDA